MKYHITEGNGYTPNASKCFKGARMAAERKQKQKADDRAAEVFCKTYLNDNPDNVPLTGYEKVNQHLAEK